MIQKAETLKCIRSRQGSFQNLNSGISSLRVPFQSQLSALLISSMPENTLASLSDPWVHISRTHPGMPKNVKTGGLVYQPKVEVPLHITFGSKMFDLLPSANVEWRGKVECTEGKDSIVVLVSFLIRKRLYMIDGSNLNKGGS
jgi:hypothetical protein